MFTRRARLDLLVTCVEQLAARSYDGAMRTTEN